MPSPKRPSPRGSSSLPLNEHVIRVVIEQRDGSPRSAFGGQDVSFEAGRRSSPHGTNNSRSHRPTLVNADEFKEAHPEGSDQERDENSENESSEESVNLSDILAEGFDMEEDDDEEQKDDVACKVIDTRDQAEDKEDDSLTSDSEKEDSNEEDDEDDPLANELAELDKEDGSHSNPTNSEEMESDPAFFRMMSNSKGLPTNKNFIRKGVAQPTLDRRPSTMLKRGPVDPFGSQEPALNKL